MNKREAKRLADEDTTQYAVFSRSKSGALSMSTVTGYLNAKIIHSTLGGVILTAGEIEKVRHSGWRPNI